MDVSTTSFQRSVPTGKILFIICPFEKSFYHLKMKIISINTLFTLTLSITLHACAKVLFNMCGYTIFMT